MRILLLIAALAFCVSSAYAQTAGPLDAVNRLFNEMAGHNPEGIKAIYAPEAQLAAIVKSKDGKTAVRVLSADAFSKLFAVRRGELKEDMYKPEVELFGDLAVVYGRYVFFQDGKISHCGTNAFHLVNLDGAWRIANASSTIEPQGCTDKEKKRTMKPR
jgi:hypothetical protein